MGTVGYIVITAEFRREGNQVVAFCPQIGITSFGQTLSEAETRLRQAIEHHLSVLEYLGQRDNFLKFHNITVCPDRPEGASLSVQTAPDSWVKVLVQLLPPDGAAAQA